MIRVCIVCLGNICRSPTAEGILRHLVTEAGLSHAIHVESAGTGSWHAGEAADPRTRSEALKRGIRLEGLAQQFRSQDFERFDYVLSVDKDNLRVLEQLAPNAQAKAKLHLLRSFDPMSPPHAEVPDPYYGQGDGFANVFDICHAACTGFLDHIRTAHSK